MSSQPHCSEFVKQDLSVAALYFLNRLRLFNNEELKHIQCAPSQFEGLPLLEVAERGITSPVPDQLSRAYGSIIYSLKHYINRPVVYILDEHNEIWKSQLEKNDFFRNWTIGSGGPHGLRTCVIYSGSAHSPFELNLQSNMYDWVVKLKPLSRESIEKFITMGATQLSPYLENLIEDDRKSNSTYDYIYRVTEGNPREVLYLMKNLAKNWKNKNQDMVYLCEDWISERKSLFFEELSRFVKKIQSDSGGIQLFHEFLKSWFADFEAHPKETHTPRIFFDTGLMFEMDKKVVTTSLAAYRAILQYFFLLVVPQLTMDIKDRRLLGIRFEMLMVASLQNERLSVEGWRYGNPDNIEWVELEKPMALLELFQKGSQRNTSYRSALYLPRSSNFNFPYWDAVMHEIGEDGKQKITFVQFTISSPDEHEKKGRIKNSIEKGMVARIISDISGIGVKTYIEGRFIKMTCDSSSLDVEFVILCWKEKENCIGSSDNVFDNILVVNREQLETRIPQYNRK